MADHVVVAVRKEFIVGPLEADPYCVGKALRDDLTGRYSALRGDFRVVYEIHESIVVVRIIDVRHRRDAYS